MVGLLFVVEVVEVEVEVEEEEEPERTSWARSNEYMKQAMNWKTVTPKTMVRSFTDSSVSAAT